MDGGVVRGDGHFWPRGSGAGSDATPEKGIRLFTQEWVPAILSTAHAVLFFLHDYRSHSSSAGIERAAHFLATRGIAVFSMDMRGHGRSAGRRGHVPSIEVLVDDAYEHLAHVVGRSPHIPYFVCGIGLGGSIAMLLAQRTPPKSDDEEWPGFVLVSTLLAPPVDRETWGAYLLNGLSHVAPILPGKHDLDTLSKYINLAFDPADTDGRKAVDNDELYYKGRINMATGRELDAASKRAFVSPLTAPVLVVHGADDVVVDARWAADLYAAIGATDKLLSVVPDGWHAVMDGGDTAAFQQVLDSIVMWVSQRSSERLGAVVQGESRKDQEGGSAGGGNDDDANVDGEKEGVVVE